MELAEVLRRRKMTRRFDGRPVDDAALSGVLAAATRAPSAGNTDALDLLVLRGPDETSAYWDTTLPEPRRQGFGWPGLLAAPVLVVIWVEPDAYPRRYAEADKASTGLGRGTDAWAAPYWWIDGGMAAALIQLAAIDAGLGVCLFGVFDHEDAVRRRFGVPGGRRAVATLAIGHGVGGPGEGAGRSAGRSRRRGDEVSHRGRW